MILIQEMIPRKRLGDDSTRRVLAALLVTLGVALPVLPLESAAKNVVEWGVAADPDLPQAVNAVKRGDFEQAITHLRKTVRANPGNADIQNLLGLSYRKIGELDKAMRHYRKALEIEPGHLGAHEYLGELYLMRDKLSKAEEHLQIIESSLSCPFGCDEYQDLKRAIEEYRDGRGG